MKIVGVSEARKNLHSLIQETDEDALIMRWGELRAVLIPYKRYQSLMEKMEDLEDALSIYETRGEEVVSLEVVRRQLELPHIGEVEE